MYKSNLIGFSTEYRKLEKILIQMKFTKINLIPVSLIIEF